MDISPGLQTPAKRLESASEAYYTLLAPWYDLIAASEKKFISRGVATLGPVPGEKILEIGFGTGQAQLLIGRSVQEGLSAGLDLSRGMARIAQKKIARAGLSSQSSLIRSNALPIPFREGVFDGIFSSFTLELFAAPHIPQVLGECRRVLKAGGRLVLVSLSRDQPLPWMGRLYQRLHQRFPILLDCRPIPVQEHLTGAGFEIQDRITASLWGLPVIIAAARKGQAV